MITNFTNDSGIHDAEAPVTNDPKLLPEVQGQNVAGSYVESKSVPESKRQNNMYHSEGLMRV